MSMRALLLRAPAGPAASPAQGCEARGRRIVRRGQRLGCRAQAEGDGAQGGAAAATEAPAAPKKSVIRRVKKAEPEPEPQLDVKAVEEPGVSLEGVIRADAGGLSLGQLALLAAGDVAAIILFVWIGRATHVSTAVDFELFKTALPFLVGWTVASVAFNEYNPSRSQPKAIGAIAGATAKPWAVGVPIGIVLRSVFKGQPPQVPFVIVSLLSTAVILTAWRYVFFTVIAKGDGDTESSAEIDKKGNVFEFFELLTSLIRRW